MLRRGLGRAVLVASDDAPSRRNPLLNACFRFVGYDSQMHDGRARYLLDVIHATGEPEFYSAALYRALANPQDDYDQVQMVELACLMARLGDEQARSAAYRAFVRLVEQGIYYNDDDLIDMDGVEGYRFVASQFAKLPPDAVQSDYLALNKLAEGMGESGMRITVAALMQGQPELADYLRRTLTRWEDWQRDLSRWRDERAARPPLTYEAIQQQLRDNPKRATLRMYGKRLNGADALRAAEEALAETDPQRKRLLLSLFQETPFPLPIEPLFPALHAEDARLRRSVVRALSQVRHPGIRPLALELAESPGRWADALGLLVSNTEPGDARLTLSWMQNIEDEDDLHDYGFALRDVVESSQDRTFIPSLLYLYENGPCSLCRYGVVKGLLKWGALPDALREECHYDADASTRSLLTNPQETND